MSAAAIVCGFIPEPMGEVSMDVQSEWMGRVVKWVLIDPDLFGLIYQASAAILLSAVIWLVAKRVIDAAVNRLQEKAFIKKNALLAESLKKLLFYLMALATGAYCIRVFDARFLANPFYAILLVLCATPVKDLLRIVLGYAERHIADRTQTHLDNVVFSLLNRFADVIVYATAVVLGLDLLGVNVMPFVAGAGVMGVAIGFAAKDTLSNLIAGVLLIIDRPFDVGDRIEVWRAPEGSATWGDVIDIGLRATKIRTTDHIVIIIPNNQIMTRDIINYTAHSEAIRVRINIGVGYDVDIDKAKRLILAVADAAPWISKTPAPKVVVRNFGESAVDLQVRVWIANARNRMDTISYMTDNVKTVFDREGIEIPFPKREITILPHDAEPPAGSERS
jgi:MscS family membrane protein